MRYWLAMPAFRFIRHSTGRSLKLMGRSLPGCSCPSETGTYPAELKREFDPFVSI